MRYRLVKALLCLVFVAVGQAGVAQAPSNPGLTKPGLTKPNLSLEKPPMLQRDVSALPAQVAAMRERILEAARSGDPEKLRIAIERNETPPVLIRGRKGDGVAILKDKSFDKEGREILARLISVLEGPFLRLNPGKPQEMFVWPAYAGLMWERLSPEEWVELYRLVPAPIIKDSLDNRIYKGDRIGIGADGTWHYFLSGE
jgi:hypothetical protein